MRGDGVNLDPTRLKNRLENIDALRRKEEKAVLQKDDYKAKRAKYHRMRAEKSLIEQMEKSYLQKSAVVSPDGSRAWYA